MVYARPVLVDREVAAELDAWGHDEPGDIGMVTFRPSYCGIGDMGYPDAVITESGKRYETTVGYS